jgi:peptidyl-prolyl cis-trans isomerase B (cyclophilin B)
MRKKVHLWSSNFHIQLHTMSITQLLLLAFVGFFPVVMMATEAEESKDKKPPKKDYLFTISTRLGEIKFVLFDETPLHKANFLELVEAGFYDSTTFHRVINNFMIQGGDPATKPDGQAVPPPINPSGWNDDNSVAAEIIPSLKHSRGMFAAARMGDQINPERRSSKSQFYIVQKPGGTPHLDGTYTVYGKVLEGMEVVDAIATVPTARMNNPVDPIYMTVTVEKMKRKKIAKEYAEYDYGKS